MTCWFHVWDTCFEVTYCIYPCPICECHKSLLSYHEGLRQKRRSSVHLKQSLAPLKTSLLKWDFHQQIFPNFIAQSSVSVTIQHCFVTVWNTYKRVSLYRGAAWALCNPSYWDGGIWGWLEDSSPPNRLLVPLWWLKPRINSNSLLGWRVGPGGVEIVGMTKFQPAWFHIPVVLDYSCYLVSKLKQSRR